MTKAEEIYHRFVQYEWHDVSDLLKKSIIQAINEAMGINVEPPCNHRWIRTTKNYKRIKRCSICAEIKNVQPKNDMQCGVGKNNI